MFLFLLNNKYTKAFGENKVSFAIICFPKPAISLLAYNYISVYHLYKLSNILKLKQFFAEYQDLWSKL